MNKREKKKLEDLVFKSETDQQIEKQKSIIETKADCTPTHNVGIQERIKIFALEMMNGLSASQIATKWHKQWGMTWDGCRVNYSAEAKKLIASELLTDEKDIRYDLLAKYNYLYQLAMAEGDRKEARGVLDSIARFTQSIVLDVQGLERLQTVQLIEVIREEDMEDAEIIEPDGDN